MRKVTLKKAIELWGGSNIEMHKCYYYNYGFFDKDGQTWYYSSGDLRYNFHPILVRTAKDRKDYTGGINQWGFEKDLERLGYYVDKVKGVPHKHE